MVHLTTIEHLNKHAKAISFSDIDASYTVITPHATHAMRLYRYWCLQQDTACLAPECLSLTQWLGQQYTLSTKQECTLMSYYEQLRLWLSVLKKLHPDYSYLYRLHLAKSYYNHWRQSQLNQAINTDELYCAALESYLSACERFALVDPHTLLRDITYWYRGTDKIVLHGFGWLDKATEHLVHTLSPHVYCLGGFEDSTRHYCRYANSMAEIYATCSQIAKLKAQYPHRLHAVVVCESSYIKPMQETLHQFCYPDSYHHMQKNSAICHSTPSMLAKLPLVKAVLLLVQYLCDPDARKLRLVLSNTYFHHTDIPRSLYDIVIHLSSVNTRPEVFIASIHKSLAEHVHWPMLHQQLTLLISTPPSTTTQHQLAQWIINHIRLTLISSLSEEDMHILGHIQLACYHAAVEYTSSDQSLSLSLWLENFITYIEHTPLNSASSNAVVYLGKWDDSIAMTCDYLWTVGAHAAVWPSTNPHVSSTHNTTQAMHALVDYHQRHCCIQSTISYAESDHQGQDLLASPYIQASFSDESYCFEEHPLLSQYALEAIYDDAGPVIHPSERNIGSQVLKLYSQCHCMGFLQKRLHINRWQPEPIGFSASDIGTVTHAALARWFHPQQTPNYEDVSQWVTRYVAHSDWPWQPTALQQSTLSDHVSDTVVRWLEHSLVLHQDEPHFGTKAEVKIQYPLGPVSMQLRADRIDYIGNEQRIVDYKTSMATRVMWDSSRMQDPQLPLYALFSDAVTAVTFGSLHPQQWGYNGVSAQKEALKGLISVDSWHKNEDITWTLQLRQWRRQLVTVAEQYAQGDAALNPKAPQVCQQCQLENVCRRMSSTAAVID